METAMLTVFTFSLLPLLHAYERTNRRQSSPDFELGMAAVLFTLLLLFKAPALAFLPVLFTLAVWLIHQGQLQGERGRLFRGLVRSGEDRRLELLAFLEWTATLSGSPDPLSLERMRRVRYSGEVQPHQLVWAIGERLDTLRLAFEALERMEESPLHLPPTRVPRKPEQL